MKFTNIETINNFKEYINKLGLAESYKYKLLYLLLNLINGKRIDIEELYYYLNEDKED